MRAFIGAALGPLEQYRLEEVARPEPKPGEIRIRVRATGLSYVDGLIAQGKYQVKPSVPFTPGGEMAGEVDALGEGVTRVKPGDRVACWILGGGLAEFAILPAAMAHPIGPDLDFAKAAALTLNYATAYYALKDRAGLKSGESLLVLGAAGGIGTAAIEVGRKLGAKVIAAASSEAKRAFARNLGAAATVDYTDPDWRQALRAANDDKAIDVVIDPVGGVVFEPAFRSLNWGGRHLVVGFTGGPIPALKANLALLKGASLVGVDIRHFSEREPDKAAANLAQLYAWAAEGALKVPLQGGYGLDRVGEALALATSGKAQGKVVVTI